MNEKKDSNPTESAAKERTIIELPKSDLFVQDNALHKRGERGSIVASHDFADILSVRVIQERNKGAFIFAAVSAAVGIAAMIFISSGLWASLACIPLFLLALLGCIAGTTTTDHLEPPRNIRGNTTSLYPMGYVDVQATTPVIQPLKRGVNPRFWRRRRWRRI